MKTEGDNSDYVDRLRTIHHGLIALCVVLFALSSFESANPTQEALAELQIISNLTQRWNSGWLDRIIADRLHVLAEQGRVLEFGDSTAIFLESQLTDDLVGVFVKRGWFLSSKSSRSSETVAGNQPVGEGDSIHLRDLEKRNELGQYDLFDRGEIDDLGHFKRVWNLLNRNRYLNAPADIHRGQFIESRASQEPYRESFFAEWSPAGDETKARRRARFSHDFDITVAMTDFGGLNSLSLLDRASIIERASWTQGAPVRVPEELRGDVFQNPIEFNQPLLELIRTFGRAGDGTDCYFVGYWSGFLDGSIREGFWGVDVDCHIEALQLQELWLESNQPRVYGNFDLSFPALSSLSAELSELPVKNALSHFRELANNTESSLDVFGAKIPTGAIREWALVLVLGFQLYFTAQLSETRFRLRSVNDVAWSRSWMGLHFGLLSRIGTVLSAFALPPMTLLMVSILDAGTIRSLVCATPVDDLLFSGLALVSSIALSSWGFFGWRRLQGQSPMCVG